MITSKNTVLRIIAGEVKNGASINLRSEKNIISAEYTVCDGKGAKLISGALSVSENTAETVALFDAKAWSIASPVLYSLTINLKLEGGEEEIIEDRFGFRYFSCDEDYIYLNGYPFYMRAYIRGCTAHEHQNNCKLEEIEFYKKNIRMAKKYGFNTIRFHSVIPPRECFLAADELGILIHIETRKDNEDYDNLTEMLYGKEDLVSDTELKRIINELYNHPSFMVYCIGNEIRMPGKNPRIKEIRDLIKKEDPTRLFIDTCAHGEFDRGYVDFDVQHMGYFFPYGRNANMFSDTDNLLCFGTVKERNMIEECDGVKIRRAIGFPRPLIAHEVCHYTSWRDFYALKEKFQKFGTPAPWWVDEEIKMIEAKGYKENFHKYLGITKNYQFRCWKVAIEGIRASKLLSGFHMLQFADTDRYENSNGVVDCFDDPHGISDADFSRFNSDTVVVARLPKQIFSAGEFVKVPVILSEFRIAPPASATFTYELKSDSKVYSKGSMADVDTFASGVKDLLALDITVPEISKPERLTLSCRLDFSDGTVCDNNWELWVFPREAEVISLDARLDMADSYLDYRCKFTENKKAPLVTDKIDAALSALERGEKVVLIYRTDWTRHLLHKGMEAPEYSFRHVWDRFKGVIWDRGTINGGFDEADLLNKHGFSAYGEINFQYYNLIDDSDKINLDDFPVSVRSLVSGLDKSSRDRFDPKFFKLPELMYDRTMRRFSYAFMLNVGKGSLLVTGFNLTGVGKGEPSAVAMLKALVSIAASESAPKECKMSVEELRKYLSDVAKSGPQKERMMTQYWQLDEEPVESIAYWEESERYLREDENK